MHEPCAESLTLFQRLLPIDNSQLRALLSLNHVGTMSTLETLDDSFFMMPISLVLQVPTNRTLFGPDSMVWPWHLHGQHRPGTSIVYPDVTCQL
jgi:hypothetical protein